MYDEKNLNFPLLMSTFYDISETNQVYLDSVSGHICDSEWNERIFSIILISKYLINFLERIFCSLNRMSLILIQCNQKVNLKYPNYCNYYYSLFQIVKFSLCLFVIGKKYVIRNVDVDDNLLSITMNRM